MSTGGRITPTAEQELVLPDRPSLGFRIANSFQTGWVGTACRTFLIGLNRFEVHGWEGFKQLLDERADVGARQRGLITVSNHTSVYVCIPLYLCFVFTLMLLLSLVSVMTMYTAWELTIASFQS